MSGVIEKTLASLPNFLSQNLLNNVSRKTMSGNKNVTATSSSRAFQTFIKVVGNARTGLEEDQLIQKELCSLKQRLGQPDVSNGQMRDYLTRLVYCNSLGYDVSFCYVNAIKLVHQGYGLDKRMGYMASCLLLPENHECILLFISTLQKDLNSTNFVDNCMALGVAGTLINTDMIVMLLPSVLERLHHKQQLVRMKAVRCLHQFHLKAPALLHHCHGDFNKMLCDKDPGVVTCALHFYHSLIKEKPEDYIHLGNPMIKLLNMVVQRKISTIFEYHTVPSPWLQILLLKILAILGSSEQNLSIAMTETLLDVLDRSTIKENIAVAILYECIETITKIYPQPRLLEKAVKIVGGLLHSANHNFRYLGLKALHSLTKISPKYSIEYQMLVVECLEESDPVIQRKTFDLLLELSNTGNVQLICKKLLNHIGKLQKFQQAEILSKISGIVLIHSRNILWYVEMMCSLCDDGCVHVPEILVDKALTVIDQGIKNEPDQRNDVVALCENYLLDREQSSAETIKLLSWVLGQYGIKTKRGQLIEQKLLSYFHEFSNKVNIQNSILTALTKLVITKFISAEEMINSLDNIHMESSTMDIQQRLKELKLISLEEIDLSHLLLEPEETHKMDFTLSFLDDFVSDSLEAGGCPYIPKSLRLSNTKHDVSYEATYETMVESQSNQSLVTSLSSQTSPNTSVQSSHSQTNETRFTDLNVKGVPQIWSKEGVSLPTKPDTFPDGLSDSSEKQITENDSKKVENEEIARKQELAAALFGHININATKPGNTTSESPLKKDSVREETVLKNSSKANWKQVHESAIQNANCDKQSTNNLSLKDEQILTRISDTTKSNEEAFSQSKLKDDQIHSSVCKKTSIYDEDDINFDDG